MKIDARHLVSDIHAGVTQDDLCRRYDLSEAQFREVFDQLVKAELLRPEEFPQSSATASDPESLPTTREIQSFKCPHCGMPQIDGTVVCCDCGVDIPSYTPPRPEETEQPYLSFLMERIREHPAAAGLIAVMFLAPILAVCAFTHTWFEVRDNLRYGPMRNEILGIRQQIEQGKYNLNDLKRMTRRYNKQLAKLKQGLEDSNPELIRLLEAAAGNLRHADDAWSHMIKVEGERGKGAAQDDLSYRDVQLDMFIYETGNALKMME